MERKMPDNSRLMDTSEHELSDIIEIITPELDGTTASSKPYLRVVEQPTRKPMRFRYKCEGRTAGTIPGENSFQETKTFPTVEIVGYNGEALILVSCVTKDKPYRQHPHQLVGKNCKSGVCTKNVGPGLPLRAEFSNIGIQCVRKKEISESLEERKKKKVDPFKTGFDHINDPNSIELNSLRLCFQGFLKSANGWEPLSPVVSEPLYDRKAKSELVISRLCSCAATIDGGDEIILLCSKVNKDDVKIRFKAIDNNQEVWHAYAEFEPSNVHKQTAIAFRTPRYPQADLPKTAKPYIELECPSLDKRSDPLEFVFHDPGMLSFASMRRKLKRRSDVDIFQHILSMDSEITATKYSCPLTGIDSDLDDNGTLSTERTQSTVSKQHSLDTLNETESISRHNRESVTYDGDLNFDHAIGIEIELEVPQMKHQAEDANTQTSTAIDEILRHPSLVAPKSLLAVDKISEWMRSNEFERTDSLTVENGDTTSLSPITVCTNVNSLSTNHTTISTGTDEDKTFTDNMEHASELDDIGMASQSRRGTFDNPVIQNLSLGGSPIGDNKSVATMVEFVATTPKNANASIQPSAGVDESFDETSTYTSLQIAFKNPLSIPCGDKQNSTVIVNDEDGLVVLKNPPAPKIRVNAVQTPPSPPSPSPPLPLPPRTPSPGPDRKLPPLPPKRKTSQELGSNSPTLHSSVEYSLASSISSRPPSQIIIMRTPDQSPTKRQTTPTSSPKKRQGFFSRLFSRRKSKTEVGNNDKTTMSQPPKRVTPTDSREPSIGNFSISDPNRSSLRSIKSLQPNYDSLNPQNSSAQNEINKNGKPVGRSVSSVSGKRPAQLNADVIHIPLKGENAKSLPSHEGKAFTFGQYLDRKTLSALQLAEIPVCDGNMELVAIADRQSIKNLCEGEFGVILGPEVDLQEAEHFALYTSIPPDRQITANNSEIDLKMCAGRDDSPIITGDEIARRLNEANRMLAD
ncbi:embryonic polarity protein dorsal isoform X2 [Anastrepha ludens]|uniref:embryonic polarity protein dorsal isoform X2 n=1 Tax=Anastrepha ludens TaxID=28586 RepID=UPI0023AF499B|nr:embryonic polarity protein dorsal isoform X2 [Anastrepha ludens]XP_053961667.1 embryonic polarity protein dorsal isoform X2 [Anastrepha ludens]XP_053961668.1 embryonic polarity protein dorsal isoform X2 [Anastrepha ludens]XP_053961669.1 embryonic polarity protein dorsal isoform X2 [Anastrepha ludens]XP_053961670.1 embryonic polarity protein dorsal isoform X2 [Anastrepha ludens]XP_053961671.1 embryonic polarity protein dorsal isoform X2 [Anastrepha ludens]XP_053961672.1 embryonic polarity p